MTEKIHRGAILRALESWVKRKDQAIAKEFLSKVIIQTDILKPSGKNWMVLLDTSIEVARDNASWMGPL